MSGPFPPRDNCYHDGSRGPDHAGTGVVGFLAGIDAPMSGVHQFVPMLHRGDAVGRHTRRLRDLFAARGIASRIYVEMVDPETAAETELATAYPDHAEPGDVAVYQFATASSMAPWLAARPETLVVNYHNITPPELVASWNNPLARGQLRAQAELRLLAPRTRWPWPTRRTTGRIWWRRGSPTASSCPRRPRSAATSSRPPGAASTPARGGGTGCPLAQRRAGGAEQGGRPDGDRPGGDPCPL